MAIEIYIELAHTDGVVDWTELINIVVTNYDLVIYTPFVVYEAYASTLVNMHG